MKKRTTLFILIIIFLLALNFWFSDIVMGQGGDTVVLEPILDAPTIEEFLEGIIKFIFQLAIVIAPLTTIWGGFLFATAAGNYEQITKAKNILSWTAIGFGIVLFARVIFEAIKAILKVGG